MSSASSCSSSFIPAAHAASILSPAQRLYRDGVHCIFAFTSLRELVFAMRTCKSWHGFGASAPLRRVLRAFIPSRGKIKPMDRVAMMCASSLRHRISAVIIDASPPLATLQLLRNSMPHLQRLAFICEKQLPVELPDDSSPLYPSALTDLHLTVHERDSSSATFHRLVRSAPALTSLTLRPMGMQGSDFTLASWLAPSMALLSNLRVLRIDNRIEVYRHQAELLLSGAAAQRQLQRLERLDFTVRAGIAGSLLAALAALPTLTHMPTGAMESSALPELRRLTNLRTLVLYRSDTDTIQMFGRAFRPKGAPAERDASLLADLVACSFLSQLRHLELRHLQTLSLEQLESLFARMPQLRVLILVRVRLHSLRFLQSLPLLEQLALRFCSDDLISIDLAGLHLLPRLGHLRLEEERFALLSEAEAIRAPRLPPSLPSRIGCFQYCCEFTLCTIGGRCMTPFAAQPFSTPNQCWLPVLTAK